MITVTFSYSDNLINGFEIKGHSGFADFGRDVVCSAVSSAAYLTVNTVTDVICAKCDQLFNNDGYMKILIDRSDCEKCSDLFNGFKLHMLQLSEQYSKYIKIIGGNTDA